MTTDCSLNYMFNTWKFQAQTWREHVMYRNCFWHSWFRTIFVHNSFSAKWKVSDKGLPVQHTNQCILTKFMLWLKRFVNVQMTCIENFPSNRIVEINTILHLVAYCKILCTSISWKMPSRKNELRIRKCLEKNSWQFS